MGLCNALGKENRCLWMKIDSSKTVAVQIWDEREGAVVVVTPTRVVYNFNYPNPSRNPTYTSNDIITLQPREP